MFPFTSVLKLFVCVLLPLFEMYMLLFGGDCDALVFPLEVTKFVRILKPLPSLKSLM